MKRPGFIVMLVVGIVLTLTGAALALAGAAAAWLGAAQNDGGYLTSRTERFTASSYALVSPPFGRHWRGNGEQAPVRRRHPPP
ncbi:hypothetical protein AAHB33_08870 [Paenarthrobacter sp. S56]|uniref:hypothetical protein n=1 Tax=Paenarthrobacter sp. S56 TaxID=3138179 RepID=UPI00321B5C21